MTAATALGDIVGAPLAEFGIRSAEAVRREHHGRPRFIVDGLIHTTSTLVYGASGTGKSWLMIDLLDALAQDSAWLGQRVTQRVRQPLVLASDGGGEREYAERLGEAARGAVMLGQPPPVDPKAWINLARGAVAEAVDLVIVDNFFSWVGAVNVNANEEVARPLACIGALTKVGVPVVMVHHTNSGGRKPAGVHSIPAHFRQSIRVTARGLTTHGNDAAGLSMSIAREGGRVVGSSRSLGQSEPPQRVGNPPPAPRRPRGAERHAVARSLLDGAGPLSSLRAAGRYLHQHMPGVGTSDAGYAIVQELRRNGWPLPTQ